MNEAEAKSKHCAKSCVDAGLCKGSDCMAWQWSSEGVLTTTTSIKASEWFETNHSAGSGASFDQIYLYFDRTNPPSTSDMPSPVGNDWTPEGKPYLPNPGVHEVAQKWTRIDQDRTGYCGLVGKA